MFNKKIIKSSLERFEDELRIVEDFFKDLEQAKDRTATIKEETTIKANELLCLADRCDELNKKCSKILK